jgi:SagB-type dehydrogenase family enzyme
MVHTHETIHAGIVARVSAALVIAVLGIVSSCGDGDSEETSVEAPSGQITELPQPVVDGDLSLESALAQRRSVRAFAPDPLSLEELGQLLWAAQGITAEWGGRTAPSAGGLYPIELHVAVAAVRGIDPGAYRYRPADHSLERTVGRDLRDDLVRAAVDQESVGAAPASIVVATVQARTAERYGRRAERYVILEAGHVAQNVALQAVALGLGSVPVGAFDDDEVAALLRIEPGERPLYILSVGNPADAAG